MFTPRFHLLLRVAPLALILLGAAAPLPVSAKENLDQLRSENGQIVVEAFDIHVAEAALTAAVESRKKMASVLGLPANGVNHIYIRVLPTEEDKEWPLPELGAILHKDQLDFSVVLRVPGPRPLEELIRTLTQVFIYEKMISNNTALRAGDNLPLQPLWLSEGLVQLCLAGETRGWEKVVSRAKKNHKAPTLDTVLKWQELSTDSVERMWQQAFSYYLVASITRPGGSRDAFQQWLIESDSNPEHPFGSFSRLLPDEFAWRAELERSADRSRDVIFSWEETSDALDQALKITLYPNGKGEEVHTSIETLKPYVNHPGLIEAAQQKVADLTDLQLRSTAPWQPVITSYRTALMSLANIQPPVKTSTAIPTRGSKDITPSVIPPRSEYGNLIRQAQAYREQIQKQHDAVSDYINWVVVTKSAGEQGSAFASYYEQRRKLDKFQPRQKDHIGRTVLKIESRPE